MKSLLLAVAVAPLGARRLAGRPAEPDATSRSSSTTRSRPRAPRSTTPSTRFTEETGIDVELLVAGDTGTMVAKAVLTAGNPEGDVMWGVDNTYLSRVVDEDVFDAVRGGRLDDIADELTDLVPGHEATPVDFGDVCVNYDIAWFADHGIEPPTDLAVAGRRREYADLLVVAEPGLLVARAGVPDGDRRRVRRRAVGRVLAATSSTTASRSSTAGPRRTTSGSAAPATDPSRWSSATAAARRPRCCSPTRRWTRRRRPSLDDTCFRQVEFAGVLRGTDAPDEARRLVDFLISEDFQAEVALNLFVYPANTDVDLPAEFTDFAVVAGDPYTLDPATIDANREDWIETWTDTVLR